MSSRRRHLVIRSQDALGTNQDGSVVNKSNFTVGLGDNGYSIQSVKLLHVSIPNGVPNITIGDTLSWTDGTGLHQQQVTVGFYNANNLATALQTIMNTLSTGYTVTFDPVRSKFTFVHTVAFQLDFTYAVCGNLGKVLGWELNALSTNTSHTSTHHADMTTRYYNHIRLTFGSQSVEYISPIGVGPLSIYPISENQLWQQSENWSYGTRVSASQVGVLLHDGTGTQVLQYIDWACVLMLE